MSGMVKKVFQKALQWLSSEWGISILLTYGQFRAFMGGGGSDSLVLGYGDNRALWLPALYHLSGSLRRGVLYGLDLLTFNGSSDFFSRPNIFGFNPFVTILMILRPPTLSGDYFRFGLIIIFLLTLVSMFAVQAIGRRWFGFNRVICILWAIGFCSSSYIYFSLGFLPFAFATLMVPILSYVFWEMSKAESLWRSTFWGTFPIIVTLTAGYGPMALMSVLCSYGFFALTLLLFQKIPFSSFLKLAKPVHFALVISGVICAPYFIDLIQTHRLVVPTDLNLFQSAYELAVSPMDLLQLISASLETGAYFEQKLSFGMVFAFFFIAFFCHFHRAERVERFRSLRRLTVFLVGFLFLSVLLVIGEQSTLSGMFYYFVPQLGKMHIYQRFLSQFSFLFYLLLALLVLEETEDLRPRFWRWMGFAGLGGVLLGSYIHHKKGMSPASSAVIVELLIVSMMSLAITILSSARSRQIVVLIALILVQWRFFYHVAIEEPAIKMDGYFEKEPERLKSLADYLNSHASPDSQIIKVLDLQPEFMEAHVPKNFPWLMESYLSRPVSSYYGYEYHLASHMDYRKRMPYSLSKQVGHFTFFPDQDLIERNGADFVIYRRDEIETVPERKWLLPRIDPTNSMDLGNDIVISKILPLGRSAGWTSNGYFSCENPAGQSAPIMRNFETNQTSHWSFDVDFAEAGRCDWLFWAYPGLKLKIDHQLVEPTIKNGEMSFGLPAGPHRVELRYENSWSFIGNFILLLFTGAWLSIFILERGVFFFRRRLA